MILSFFKRAEQGWIIFWTKVAAILAVGNIKRSELKPSCIHIVRITMWDFQENGDKIEGNIIKLLSIKELKCTCISTDWTNSTHLDSIEFVSIDYNFPFYRFDGVWCVIQILRLKNMLKWLSVTVQIFEHGFTNIWFLEHKRSRRSLCLGIEGWQTWKFGKWGLQLGTLVIQAVIWVDIPEFGKIQGNPWKETNSKIGNWQFEE